MFVSAGTGGPSGSGHLLPSGPASLGERLRQGVMMMQAAFGMEEIENAEVVKAPSAQTILGANEPFASYIPHHKREFYRVSEYPGSIVLLENEVGMLLENDKITRFVQEEGTQEDYNIARKKYLKERGK